MKASPPAQLSSLLGGYVSVLSLSVTDCWLCALAQSPQDRLKVILERPGEIQVDDVAFLQGHSKELVSFAEGFTARSGLAERQERAEEAPLLKLVGMLEPVTDFPAYRLEQEILVRLIGIAARSRGDTAEALCKVLLRADDFSIARIGMEVSATPYPDFLVEALDRQQIKRPFQREAVVMLALAGAKNALPVLDRIAKEAAGSKLGDTARLAIVRIEGAKLPDHFDKSTPEKFARSYVGVRQRHPDRYVEDDAEFFGNPMFERYAEKWREYLALASDDKKKRDLAQSLQVAKWLEEALKEPNKCFVVQRRECMVLVEGKEVIRLYRDIFDQWRFLRMP